MRAEKEIGKYAKELGFELIRGGGSKHYVWRLPGVAGQVVTSASPSDQRGVRQTKSMLRRHKELGQPLEQQAA